MRLRGKSGRTTEVEPQRIALNVKHSAVILRSHFPIADYVVATEHFHKQRVIGTSPMVLLSYSTYLAIEKMSYFVAICFIPASFEVDWNEPTILTLSILDGRYPSR